MKKKLLSSFLGVIVAVTAISTSGTNPDYKNIYPRTCVILNAHHTPDWSGYMIIADYGHYKDGRMYTWIINKDPEDLAAGEVISCNMHDNNTADILDDYIISYRYAGLADDSILDK